MSRFGREAAARLTGTGSSVPDCTDTPPQFELRRVRRLLVSVQGIRLQPLAGRVQSRPRLIILLVTDYYICTLLKLVVRTARWWKEVRGGRAGVGCGRDKGGIVSRGTGLNQQG